MACARIASHSEAVPSAMPAIGGSSRQRWASGSMLRQPVEIGREPSETGEHEERAASTPRCPRPGHESAPHHRPPRDDVRHRFGEAARSIRDPGSERPDDQGDRTDDHGARGDGVVRRKSQPGPGPIDHVPAPSAWLVPRPMTASALITSGLPSASAVPSKPHGMMAGRGRSGARATGPCGGPDRIEPSYRGAPDLPPSRGPCGWERTAVLVTGSHTEAPSTLCDRPSGMAVEGNGGYTRPHDDRVVPELRDRAWDRGVTGARRPGG